MLDAVAAHIELVERNHILREIVADTVIRAKLAGDRLVRRQKIRHLNVQLLAAFAADKVDFPLSASAHRELVAPAEQLQIDNILQNQIDVPQIAAEDRLADAVVCKIILLVGGENLLPL